MNNEQAQGVETPQSAENEKANTNTGFASEHHQTIPAAPDPVDKWVEAISDERLTMSKAESELYGQDSKKKDKWYHEAKREKKIKVNIKAISEEDAVLRLIDGKDVFTLNEELAKNAVNKAIDALKKNGVMATRDGPEKHKNGKVGYYLHYHINIITHRPHIWWDD